MENKNMGLLIGAFVMLIVGVSLVTVVAGQSNLVAEKTVVQGEEVAFDYCVTGVGGDILFSINAATCSNLSVANAPAVTDWQYIEGCTTDLVTLDNVTLTPVVTTDYIWYPGNGTIAIVNSTWMQNSGNSTYIDYNYCGNDYVNSSFGRTGMDIAVGFFAIALMLGAVGMFYQVLKNEGLTNL